MARTYHRNRPTRELILQAGMRLFLEQGYTNTHCSRLTKELGISPGNLTFYFPTKEHLLTQLVEDLCSFQWMVMEQTHSEGNTYLLSYCMELAAMAALCQQSPNARDFYLSSYTHPMSLAIIRQQDAQKAKRVFGEFCPEFTDDDFADMENIVSGIEYGMLSTPSEDLDTLNRKVSHALDSILLLYRVPKKLREEKLAKVMASHYWENSMNLLHDFANYVEAVNAKAVEAALEQKHHT